MNRNLLLLIVLAALVGGGILVQKNRESHLNNAGAGIKLRELLLPELPVKDVRKIHVQDGANQVNLTKVDGKWLVAERGNYPASQEKVARTLLSLGDIKISSGKHVKKDSRGSYKLLAGGEGQPFESGLQVELLNEKGDVLTSIIAGKYMQSSGGASSNSFNGSVEQRFVRLPSDGETAWLINDIFYDIQATPQEWLDKGFLDVRKLKDVTITGPNAADSWAAQRKDENSDFTLMDAKLPGDELDTAKANGLGTLLSQPTFTDVLTKDKITPSLMAGAISTKINTFEGFHYDIKVAAQGEPGASEPKYYLTSSVTADIPKERKAEPNEKPEDKKKKDDEFAAKKTELEEKLAKENGYDGWVYNVASYTVSMITKKRSEVLREKTPPPPTPQIKVPTPHVPITPPPAPSPPPPPPAAEPKPAAPAEPKSSAATEPVTAPKSSTPAPAEKPAAPPPSPETKPPAEPPK